MTDEIPKIPGEYQLKIDIEDEQGISSERTFLLYIPQSYSPDNPTPLVTVYHGATGSGKRVSGVSRFSEAAEKYGFIIAYPDGIDGFWNDGREVRSDHDDVGFTAALLDKLTAELKIDAAKIYASGISNGAMMVLRLACELSDMIAAIAPVAGTFPENVALICTPAHPVSVILFHGTEDEILPYDGGEIQGSVQGSVLAAMKTAETWAQLNGCSAEPETTIFPVKDPTDGTQVRLDAFACGTTKAEVHLYTIYGGGHTWPSGKNSTLLNLGRTSREIKATDVIWEFFENHPKEIGIL